MTDLKILCTADLHLGRASACLETPAGVDTTAAGAWLRVAKRAVEEGAHAVVIAGDVFDGTGSYYETRAAFRAGLAVLERAGIPVVAVAGNHDYESLPRFARQSAPANFHLLGAGGVWESLELETSGGRFRLVGWSFPRERVPLGQFGSLAAGSSALPTVGICHGDVGGKSNYHPILATDLERGADAWVLGHVHAAREVSAKAHYPGSPQALDFGPGERGAHGFKWLSLGANRVRFSELVPVSTVRFEDLELMVESQGAEEPWNAAYRTAEERARHWRNEQPGLESVQLRGISAFSSCAAKLTVPGSHELSQDGSDAIWFTGYRVRPAVDPWDLVETPRAKGVMAKLLLGLRRDPLDIANPRWNPAWVGQADELVERSAGDVISQFNRTLQQISDEGDYGRPEPEPEQAMAMARRHLIGELESMLEEMERV